MATIFELSPYNLYRLQSLDPILDDNYRDILEVIFPILDTKSQDMLLARNLNPRGIHCDLTRKMFSHDKPATIEEIIPKLTNSRLIAMSRKMQAQLSELPLMQENAENTPTIEAMVLAGHIEGLLYALDKIKPHLNEIEEKEWLMVRQAFLYELAQIIPQVNVVIEKNKRGITAPVVKTFIKEVFIKHELQGVNFRAWDSDDFEALKLNHFPQALKSEIESRRLSIVETARYWFLVAPIRTLDINRYSICRFLTEDTDYGLYITYGCYIPRHHVNDDIIQVVLRLISTIYTLEVSASATLLNFMEESKKAFMLELQPLLRQRLDFNGDLEEAVAKRLDLCQKKLDNLILSKMPVIMQAIVSNPDDRAIFVHYVSVFFNNLWQDIELFSLLPATEYVDATQILSNRIMCYRLFLKKSQEFYWKHELNWDSKVQEVLSPTNKISQLYQDIRNEQEQIVVMRHQLDAYEESISQGKFFAKLGFGRPKYTKEDLDGHIRSLSEDFFMQIITMAKKQRQFMVYCEFEGMVAGFNEADYRHYSVPTGKTGLDKLPLLARLPEKRQNFDVSTFELI